MIAHTLGPWKTYISVITGCRMIDGPDGSPVDMNEANAKLIASAPEFYEQLERIIKAHDANSGNEPSRSVFEREIDIARLLISES